MIGMSGAGYKRRQDADYKAVNEAGKGGFLKAFTIGEKIVHFNEKEGK
ncbi:hypothetical protein SAMN02799616_03385 [Paenibacillus sp. UNC499MF]|nr:hypothetical protein SAMN02799616_03385 [Paenibacillus sp. UNC499MF]